MDLDGKPMEEITYDSLKGITKNQALHFSHICCLFIKILHEIQSLFGNLPDFMSYFHYET